MCPWKQIGTVLVEAKSGYGLDAENEMKMLRVVDKAKKELPIDISSTFCGAHAVPKYRPSILLYIMSSPLNDDKTLQRTHCGTGDRRRVDKAAAGIIADARERST